MTDTCRITKPGEGEPVFNSDTGQYEDPPPVTVYEGACRLRVTSDAGNISDAAAGEATWTVQDPVLSLPVVGSEAVGRGMTVEYLTAAFDAALVGRRFGIVGPHHESQATARRLRVKEAV